MTLGDKLRSVELCDDGLEDLVTDGRKDLLVKVLAQLTVNCGDLEHVWTRQHTQADVDLRNKRTNSQLTRCMYGGLPKTLTICKSFEPVGEVIFLGLDRMS